MLTERVVYKIVIERNFCPMLCSGNLKEVSIASANAKYDLNKKKKKIKNLLEKVNFSDFDR